MKSSDPLQQARVPDLTPIRIQSPIILVHPHHSFPQVITPDQRPQRPVKVQVGGNPSEAVQVPVVVRVRAPLVKAKLADEERPLLEEEEGEPHEVADDLAADAVGVAGGPSGAVGEGVPVELKDELAREGEVDGAVEVEEGEVLVVAEAREDDEHVRVRCVDGLRSSLHVPAKGRAWW